MIYTIQRILEPMLKLEGLATLGMIDPSGLRKVGRDGVRIPLRYPYSDLPSQLGHKSTSIVKAETTTFLRLNGTGPFEHTRSSQRKISFKKNDPDWLSGRPKADRLEFVNIPDAAARLSSGTVDIINPVDAAQVAVIRRDPHLRLVMNLAASYVPFQMKVGVDRSGTREPVSP